jgi:hypothetical protein
MAMLLHIEAGHEDVLDDPEAFLLLDLQNTHLVAAADFDERKIGIADVDSFRGVVGCERHREVSLKRFVRIKRKVSGNRV